MQKVVEHSELFISYQNRLNLQKNQKEVYECRGKIEGAYPICIPSEATLFSIFKRFYFQLIKSFAQGSNYDNDKSMFKILDPNPQMSC